MLQSPACSTRTEYTGIWCRVREKVLLDHFQRSMLGVVANNCLLIKWAAAAEWMATTSWAICTDASRHDPA